MARTSRKPDNPGAWPRWMRAPKAAAYVDEVSVEAFRRGIGTIYPLPDIIPGKGQRWRRERLDEAIDRVAGTPETINDLADEL